MSTINEYYKGKGTAYLRKRSGGGMLPIGNASEISLAFNVSTQEMKDYENAGGGLADSIDSIESVSATIQLANLNPTNIALATAGKVSTEASTSVGAEEHTVIGAGTFIKLKKVPDTNETVTVDGVYLAWAATTEFTLGQIIENSGKLYECTQAGTTGGTFINYPEVGAEETDGSVKWKGLGDAPLYKDGTDYELKNGGILILDGGLTNGTEIKISYTSIDTRIVETLLEVGEEYELYFDGLNEARSGKPFLVTMHRVKIAPTDALPLIGDDYAQMSITVRCLKDETITGSQKSKYVKTEVAA